MPADKFEAQKDVEIKQLTALKVWFSNIFASLKRSSRQMFDISSERIMASIVMRSFI